jgi:hypothetical protein
MKEVIQETFETTDIPPDRLASVVATFMLDNPLRVEKVKQSDGNWTVRATYAKDEVGQGV